MPRQSRLDYPGALHHIIAHGIERREIYKGGDDYHAFLDRLGHVLEDTSTPCYAFALMPNHFHLLLMTAEKSIGRVMQRVLTSYAQYFNRRHKRSGHLFQNRHKSILCDADAYFLELIRYIHLNPHRAHIARTMAQLEKYPYTGHPALIGNGGPLWYQTSPILASWSHPAKCSQGAEAVYARGACSGPARRPNRRRIGAQRGRYMGVSA